MSAPPINPPYSSVGADDAIAKRRDALAKLKLRQSQPPMGGDLVARAKSQLSSGAGAPPIPPTRGPSLGASKGPPPPTQQPAIPIPIPMQQSRRRSSDIFPGVEKVVAAEAAAQQKQQQQKQQPPPPGGRPAAAPPPGPGVARRLDPSFAADRQRDPRSKSAPPSRPPPPSPNSKAGPSPPKEAPERPRPPPPGRAAAAGAAPPPKPKVPGQVNPAAKPAPPKGPSPRGPPPTAKPPPDGQGEKKSAPPLVAEKPPNNAQPSSGPPPTGAPPVQPQKPPDKKKGAPPLLVSVIGGGPPPPTDQPAGVSPFVSGPLPGKTTIGMPRGKGDQSSMQAMVPVSQQPPLPGGAAPSADPQTRDAMLRTLREEAATPPIENKPTKSIELRLQMELSRSEKDKGDALRKVSELQKEVIDLKEAQEASEDLHALIQLADTKGEKSALQWARQRASVKGGSGKQASFLARITSGAAPASPHRRRSIPRPKSKHQQLDPAILKQAAEQVEHEYVADLATYVIRRPFGMAVAEREFWMAAGQLNAKGYEKRSSSEKPASLEVAARINADGSLLLVYDESMARHQNKQGHWEDFGDVFQRETLLGTVSYVDKDGNEQDYSLDDVFEGARAVREHYCHAVVSTAAGLKASRRNSNAPPPQSQQAQAPDPAKKVATSNKNVGTEDLPFPAGDKGGQKENPKKKKKELPPPDDNSSDVLAVFFGMFANSILSFLYFVFIGIPLRIMTFFVVFGSAVILLCLARLYMMDEYGAASLGGPVNVMYNQPGIM